MLLRSILLWTLNNRVLLALQDFFVTPVLKRLPRERYESIRYKKNILFKLTSIGAGTLCWRHLKAGNVDLSVRYACEIVSNQGYVFYSQNWKAYLLYVGLVHAYRRDTEQASLWLSEGIARQKSQLIDSINTQSYPGAFVDWLGEHVDNLTSAEGWQAEFSRVRDSEEDYELLLVYITAFLLALQLTELAVTFFDSCEIRHHSDWKKMIVYRQHDILQSQYCTVLASDEIWHGTYPDIGQKLAANVLQKTFAPTDFHQLDKDDDFQALASTAGYEHVSSRRFALAMNACGLVNATNYTGVIELLASTIEDNADYLSSISCRQGPVKLFLAGFGWSGSSAVHDACRGYPHTRDMPGAGDLPGLNIGADSEPMLHQGAGGLGEMVHDIKSKGRISEATLKNFFKNHVLLMPSFGYLEYKTVNANRSIIEHIGLDDYYLLICQFLYEYARAMGSPDTGKAMGAAESLQENIVNAMFSDDDIVFFNNSVFAHRAKILEHIRGRSYYIVVNRRMSDQFCDQMRSNKFFNATFLEFYLVKLTRIVSYTLAKKTSTNEGVTFIDIMFESWVQDAALRERIAREICGSYDQHIEAQYFQPEKSSRNINIPRDQLGSFDRKCLNVFEKIGLSI